MGDKVWVLNWFEFVCEEIFYERQDFLCFQNLKPHFFDQPIWCIEEVLISYLCVLKLPLSFVPSKHIRSWFVGSFTSLVKWDDVLLFPLLVLSLLAAKRACIQRTPPFFFFNSGFIFLKSLFLPGWLVIYHIFITSVMCGLVRISYCSFQCYPQTLMRTPWKDPLQSYISLQVQHFYHTKISLVMV